MSSRLKKILQEVESLNEAERQELRRRLDARLLQSAELSTQQKLRQALVEKGLVDPTPPTGKDPGRFRSWEPVVVAGKPLSQTIIEERR